MVWGILAAVLYLLTTAVYMGKRMKSGKLKKVIFLLHKPLGYSMLGISVIHFLTVLKLFEQRPTGVFIFGGLTVISVTAAVISAQFRQRFRKAMLIHRASAFAVILFLIPHVFFSVTSLNTYMEKVNAIEVTDIDISSLSDGKYTGEYDVEYIYAKVEVIIKQGKISEMKLLEHRNERGKAGEAVIDRISRQQRLDVDSVTGATNSSKVIKKAVENALRKPAE